MTIYRRVPLDYVFGTLNQAMAISDLTANSACFAGLATTFTSGSTVVYAPLVLHDPSLGVHEVVWIVGHGAGSQQVTVLRGREGTAAQPWPSGTQVICAPTASRDALTFFARAGSTNLRPPDAHVGMRNLDADVGAVVELTELSGWQPSVGVALATDVGPDINLANPPSDAAVIMRAGRFHSTTASDGTITVSYRNPFPNGTISVVVTAIGVWDSPLSVNSVTASGFVLQAWATSGFPAGTKLGAGGDLGAFYQAVGY